MPRAPLLGELAKPEALTERLHCGSGLSHKKEYVIMQIFNTLTRQKEEFVPQVPGEYRIYV